MSNSSSIMKTIQSNPDRFSIINITLGDALEVSPNIRGFIPDVDGTLSIENHLGDIIAIPVIAGVEYRWVPTFFRTTGTSGVTALFGLI